MPAWIAWIATPLMIMAVAVVFMRVTGASALSKIFALAGVFWIIVLLGLGSVDYALPARNPGPRPNRALRWQHRTRIAARLVIIEISASSSQIRDACIGTSGSFSNFSNSSSFGSSPSIAASFMRPVLGRMNVAGFAKFLLKLTLYRVSTNTNSAAVSAVIVSSVSPSTAAPSRVPTCVPFTVTDPEAGTR